MDESDLDSLASDLVDDFEADRQSRSDWARSYVKGLDLLGMKIEERQQPWAGASGVFHPVLTESVIRFQAQAMGEIFPPICFSISPPPYIDMTPVFCSIELLGAIA